MRVGSVRVYGCGVGVGVGAGVAPAGATNKGFARRPQEFRAGWSESRLIKIGTVGVCVHGCGVYSRENK